MTTQLKPREIQNPIEGVRPATRPAAPTSAIKIEEEYHGSGTVARAAQPHRRLIRVKAGIPSPRKKGVWSAVLALINGPAVTQRERTRREAYVERIKGNGTLTRFVSPRT